MTVRGAAGRRWGAAATALAVWLCSTTTAWAWPRSGADGDEVGRTVRDVLREPAFTSAQDTWLARLRDDIRQWFFERLQQLFSSGAGTVLAWVLVGLAVVVGLAVAVRALQGTRRGATTGDGPAAVVVTRRPPADWLADARAAQAAGDLAEAVRCGYRAVVASLAGTSALEEVPGRTVGEYRAQVATNRPDRLDEFTRASDVFERVWYARRPASPADVAAVVAVADGLATAGRRGRVEAGTGVGA